MKTERSIEIDAPAAVVWGVISDIERWAEWTASVSSIERLDGGELGVGSRARVRQPKLPATVWRVSACEPGRFFEWRAVAPGSKVTGWHGVEATAAGSRATLWIDQAGLVGAFVGLLYKKLTRDYIEMEARGLKRRSESLARG